MNNDFDQDNPNVNNNNSVMSDYNNNIYYKGKIVYMIKN